MAPLGGGGRRSWSRPNSPTRELTLEEAVSFAILLQKNAQLAEAGELHRRVLEVAPDHPRALHYAGVLAHQQGRNDDALALIERSIALVAGQADWHSNLGIVLQSAGRLDRAIDSYRRAIALDPAHANAHSNLGVLLRATGQPAEAEAAYRAAIRLDPDHVDAWTNLGILLDGLKRTEEAAACYCKVVTLRPKHRDARKLLALAHCMLGETGKAVSIFEDWLAEEPDDPIARHMLAACTGREVPARASNAFVEATFDNFASSFDAKLAKLSYRAPALVAAMLEDAGVKRSHRLDVLDAGCGTGLCGALVAPFARRLVGVDLSEKMLAHAKEKNVYHALIKAELTEFLCNHRERLRPDRVGRRPRVFRRPRRRHRRRRRSAAPGRAVRLHARACARRRCCPSAGDARPLQPRPRLSSSNCSRPRDCSRRSSRPNCAWRRACRCEAWWSGPRKRIAAEPFPHGGSIAPCCCRDQVAGRRRGKGGRRFRAHILIGEPVSTSPGYAPGGARVERVRDRSSCVIRRRCLAARRAARARVGGVHAGAGGLRRDGGDRARLRRVGAFVRPGAACRHDAQAGERRARGTMVRDRTIVRR